jgi:predicted peptidase
MKTGKTARMAYLLYLPPGYPGGGRWPLILFLHGAGERGGDPEAAHRMAHLPVWAFHGAQDPVVPLEVSQQMVMALKKAAGSVTLTVYPQAGHDAWTETYRNPALYEWFLRHRRVGGKRR